MRLQISAQLGHERLVTIAFELSDAIALALIALLV